MSESISKVILAQFGMQFLQHKSLKPIDSKSAILAWIAD
jgi:hypothetical protein